MSYSRMMHIQESQLSRCQQWITEYPDIWSRPSQIGIQIVSWRLQLWINMLGRQNRNLNNWVDFCKYRTRHVHDSPLGRNDHACLTFYLKCYRNKPDQTRKFYLYYKGDFKQMNADLVNINWGNEIGHLADPSSAYAAFSEIMLALIDKHVPTKALYPSLLRQGYPQIS